MCGRFALATPPEALRQLVDFSNRVNFPARYNIAPTQPVSVIRATPEQEMALVSWGLVAPWLKPEQVGDKSARPQINARAETITEKPSFKNAFRRRRCLIPADAIYEWDRKIGQPYRIHRADNTPFFMAGIWEIWTGADGSEIESCAIITTAANDVLSAVHHRMPALIDAAHAADWLHVAETRAETLLPLLGNAPQSAMLATPISKRVNKVSEDDADLWEEHRITPPAKQMDLF
jgi:putative SOS response-associated peptidase YedK